METEPDLPFFLYLCTNTHTHVCRHIYTFIHAITLLLLKTLLHMDALLCAEFCLLNSYVEVLSQVPQECFQR